MNFKRYFILLFICLNFGIMAQTKMIWHKSHSGNMNSFKNALENKSYGVEFSNFGIPTKSQKKAMKKSRHYKSVMFVADTMIIITRKNNWIDTLHKSQDEQGIFEEKSKIKQNFKKNYSKYIRGTKFMKYKEKDIQKDPIIIKGKNKEIQRLEKTKHKKGRLIITNIERQKPNNNHSLLIYTLLGIVLIFSLILAWFTRQFSKIETIK